MESSFRLPQRPLPSFDDCYRRIKCGDTDYVSKSDPSRRSFTTIGGSLHHNLPPDETVHQLIFSPEFSSVENYHPASALCLTERRWLIALAEPPEGVTVESATLEETLLIELTIVLLHGKVKIDFIKGSERRSASLYFNTAMKSVYFAAVCEMLRAIDREGGKEIDQKTTLKVTEWPYEFQHRAIIHTPPGSGLLDGVHSDIYLRAILWRKSAEPTSVDGARIHRHSGGKFPSLLSFTNGC
jgi:hypothetical protein